MKIDGPFYAQLGDAASEANRLAIYAPYAAPDAMWQKIISELKRA